MRGCVGKTKRYVRKCPQKLGFSLIEVALFASIISISVIGASGYRYFSAMSIRDSEEQMRAGRTGQLLLESWRGVRGISSYDPLSDTGLGVTIIEASEEIAPDAPLNFITLGCYKVTEAGVDYYITLSYFDIDSRLRILNSKMSWAVDRNGDNQAGVGKTFDLTSMINR